MSATLTVKNNINNVTNLFNDITSNSDAYYFWVGKPSPWPNDSQPPNAENDYEEFEQSIYSDIVFGKQITNSNIAFLAPNYPWTNNTIYSQYDPNDPNLFSEPFFVVNQNYSVYKCIDNNNGANSIVQPNITPTVGTFQTSDGYTWKYMFTIPINANTTFTSNSFIPVVPNTFVSNNAVPGTIDIIRVNTPGSNFQAYNEGYIQSVLSINSVKIANGAQVDNFYTGSSIYLKAGLGADQIRKITGYSGGTGVVSVSPAFNTYVNLFLANINGSFILGQTVGQNIADVSYIFPQGNFNLGDTLVQSDSGASGTVASVNSSVIVLNQISSNNFNVTSGAYPIIDTIQAPVAQTGLVSVTLGSNVVTATTANLLHYSVNQYIQVGANSGNNVRRITSITNSSYANVSVPFNTTLVANVNYVLPFALEPTSAQVINSSGQIIQTSLNSIILSYTNVSSNSLSFINGETVKEYDVNGVDQHSNAIISFTNSSSLILSSINGTLAAGLFLVGQSSTLKAQIQGITSYPNITISDALGTFLTGDQINLYNANNNLVGNATLLSFSYTPSGLTQYVISPSVNISGDGTNALAYSVVNTAPGNNFGISEVVMINNGMEFTTANVSISANSLWGNGATATAIISPIQGHGSNTYSELGASFAGISMTIDIAANENYYFPAYGSYRRFGIIKNPLFNDVFLSTDNVHRGSANIQITNSNTFVNSEIIYQYSTSSAAKIVSANSTYLTLSDVNGTFTSNTSNSTQNNVIIGLTSNAIANVVNFAMTQFNFLSNDEPIYQNNNQIGILTQVVSNNEIRVTNASGKIMTGSIINDPASGGYANVLAILTANGYVNSSVTFGKRFNQTSRLTLSSNSSTPFQIGEYVNQVVTNAVGYVIATNNEVDFLYTPISGVMTVGLTVKNASNLANGIITFANTTYLRVSAVQGTFSPNDVISIISANGTINNILQVLVVSDVYQGFFFQTGTNIITGNTSGAQGLLGIANTIVYPDLVRNSGDVLYVNDISPFTVNPDVKETFNLVWSL